ncbi:hypothetical protein HXX76_012978 [Chlamydomonas incerta]|uniref:BTB domain-containing protein n=1 Tax=Chlamydomonas incerta TaxID=51695 RepID=A0A835SG88_CHLIN|nr:hypothetical protein HXX76_012978 [Chlamydomonas incerta]|eukprot:KAG2426667.1 hypothetical protein HXX76_012978 [Chlamydomonas incerta]
MAPYVLTVSLPVDNYLGIASRPTIGGECSETLVASDRSLRPLTGGDGHRGLGLESPIQLWNTAGVHRATYKPLHGFADPVWDRYSASLFVICGFAVCRVVGDVVSVVAGRTDQRGNDDGAAEARFSCASWLISAGAGVLYCSDGKRIRQIQLPESVATPAKRALSAAGLSASRQATGVGDSDRAAEAAAGAGDKGAPGAGEVAWVATLPLETASPICGLVFVPNNGSVNSTSTSGSGSGDFWAGRAQRGGYGSKGGSCGSSGNSSHNSNGGGGHSTQGGSLIWATSTALYVLPLASAAAVPRPAASAATAAAQAGKAGGGTGPAGESGSEAGSRDNSPPPEACRAAGTTPTAAPAPAPAAPIQAAAPAAATAAVVTGPTARGAPAPAAAAAAPALSEPVLQPQQLAGREGRPGCVDGRGLKARFRDIGGLTMDASGAILLVDREDEQGTTSCVRRVARDGSVVTLVAGLEGRLARPAILPNGYLALGSHYGDTLLMLDLGLTPVPLHGGFGGAPGCGAGGAGGGAGPGMGAGMGAGAGSGGWLTAAAVELSRPPRTLFGDLGALLDAQPDDSSDLVIRVGERRFHVHRLILATRCDYFKQRLAAGTFADGRAAELELPDADPDAFWVLLRWLYTGGADIPPARALAVAELSDRLLLPELCLAAQGRLLSGVQPDTIVTALLWADARAPASVRLRVELKAWYVAHYEEVRRTAPEGIMRLMVSSPSLALELMDATHEAARQQHK